MKDKITSVICFSHIGKRINHEDNFCINGKYLTSDVQKQMSDGRFYYFSDNTSNGVALYAISDGMGGHNAGEVASRICVEKLAEIYEKMQRYSSLEDIVAYLQSVITKINQIVCDLSCKKKEFVGMGATLVIAIVFGEKCAVLNIGDSRAYHYSNGSLFQITKDHTEGQRMIDLGILTRKEISEFPANKNLNRYIGCSQNGYILQADEYYFSLEEGMILLCSDGISDFISNIRISEILFSESSLETAGKLLIKKAVSTYNADNATLILIPLSRR